MKQFIRDVVRKVSDAGLAAKPMVGVINGVLLF
jgi:hypothetical protein